MTNHPGMHAFHQFVSSAFICEGNTMISPSCHQLFRSCTQTSWDECSAFCLICRPIWAVFQRALRCCIEYGSSWLARVQHPIIEEARGSQQSIPSRCKFFYPRNSQAYITGRPSIRVPAVIVRRR